MKTQRSSSPKVTDMTTLEGLYPPPMQTSLSKEQTVVTDGYRDLIAAAPFAIVATRGPLGLDCSPRGDGPGFITVLDEQTLLLPDRRGNNRLDTLKNLLFDDSIALILLIPGLGETIRIRGTAFISTDPDLIALCQKQGPPPITVMVITVSRIYFQCQRALVRSNLWDPDVRVERGTLPTAGDLLAEAHAMSTEQAQVYDANMDDYVATTLYDR